MLPDPSRQASRSLKRFFTTLDELDEYDRDQALDKIADTVATRGNGGGALELLEELARLIRARLDRN
jgi:hypothetical protein